VPVGAETVLVDSSPLPAAATSFVGEKVLARRSARQLVLRPGWQMRLLGVGCFLLAAAALGGTLLILHLVPPSIRSRGDFSYEAQLALGIIGSSVFIAVGFAFLLGGRRVRFDLDADRVTDRRLGSRKTLPLRDVIAVQLLTCRFRLPWSLRLLPFRTVFEQQLPTRGFQLNLALKDPYQPRINLAFTRNGQWVRQAGRDLASFLGVPLIDLVALEQKKGPAALKVDATAQQVPQPAGPEEGLAPTSLLKNLVLWPMSVIFAALGTIFAATALAIAVSSWSFASGAVRTEGTVSSGGRRAVVRYEVDGRVYQVKSSISFSPPAYSVGEKVQVLYLPDNPAVARIDSFVDRWLFPVIFGAPGALFATIGYGMLLARLRRGKRGKRERDFSDK
jgi:hypothetical protein